MSYSEISSLYNRTQQLEFDFNWQRMESCT